MRNPGGGAKPQPCAALLNQPDRGVRSQRTAGLAEVVAAAVGSGGGGGRRGKARKRSKLHPATRTFQGLRIEVPMAIGESASRTGAVSPLC